MDREIKYKALDKIDNKIKDVISIDFNTKTVVLYYLDESKKENLQGFGMFYTDICLERKLSDVVLLQYTGLKDKNEDEIYEGNKVKIGDFIYSVTFEIGSFMLVRCSDKTDMYKEFNNCWNDDVYPLCQLHWESNAEENILYNCEIIGYIYDSSKPLNA